MSGRHAATVTRCDSGADFGACPCRGYSAAAGSPFGAYPCHVFRDGRAADYFTVFTSSLYIAGLVATLAAASITWKYGRRTSMLIGGTVFIAVSVFGGAASNVPMLLINRILLGIDLGFTNQVTYA